MCGIVAAVGNNIDSAKIRLAHVLMTPRGTQSCGIFTDKEGSYKTTDSPIEFVADETVVDMLDGSKVAIMHNRYATVGAKTADNAHPFKVESPTGRECFGVHNGWLKNWKQTYAMHFGVDMKLSDTEFAATRGLKAIEKSIPEVDSEAFYVTFADTEYNPEHLTHYYGAAAYVYHLDGMLHVFRRESKPLFMGEIDGTMYFASIEEGLEAIECTDIREVPKNILHKYSDDGRLVEKVSVTPAEIDFETDMRPMNWQSVIPEGHELEEKYSNYDDYGRYIGNRFSGNPYRGIGYKRSYASNDTSIPSKPKSVKPILNVSAHVYESGAASEVYMHDFEISTFDREWEAMEGKIYLDDAQLSAKMLDVNGEAKISKAFISNSNCFVIETEDYIVNAAVDFSRIKKGRKYFITVMCDELITETE